MDAVVAVEVDALERLGGAGNDARRQPPRASREREDAAVVVGVGVDVEQAGVEGSGDGVDRASVAALGDIRNREQRPAASGCQREVRS